MAYSFTPSIKPYVISSLYEAMKSVRPAARKPLTSYSIGAQTTNGNNRYIAIQDGVTNSGAGPTNSTGASYDGTVRWLALGVDTVQDGDIISNLYLGIGKQTEWPNPSIPSAPNTSPSGEKEALNDLTTLLKLESSNLRLGLTNQAWTSGTEYSQYSPDVSSYPTPHYVIVSGSFVYKCLDNNGGSESVDSPSGTSTALIETADGYIWKYVGQISGTDMFAFGTPQFVPAPSGVTTTPVVGEISTFVDLVSTPIPFDDDDNVIVEIIGDGNGAEGSTRLSVAGGTATLTGIYATAGGNAYSEGFAVAYKDGALGSGAELIVDLDAGEVDSIAVDEPGEDYVSASIVIIGDGTGATATAVISSGLITTINVTDPGENYTWARAFVIPGTAGGVAKAILSPVGGHGSNLDTELGVSSILISSRLSASLSEYIPTEPVDTDGSFRQVTLVSGARGTTRNAPAMVGPSHPDFTSGSQVKYLEGSGFVLYINNITAIDHTSSQEEVIKISITL